MLYDNTASPTTGRTYCGFSVVSRVSRGTLRKSEGVGAERGRPAYQSRARGLSLAARTGSVLGGAGPRGRLGGVHHHRHSLGQAAGTRVRDRRARTRARGVRRVAGLRRGLRDEHAGYAAGGSALTSSKRRRSCAGNSTRASDAAPEAEQAAPCVATQSWSSCASPAGSRESGQSIENSSPAPTYTRICVVSRPASGSPTTRTSFVSCTNSRPSRIDTHRPFGFSSPAFDDTDGR